MKFSENLLNLRLGHGLTQGALVEKLDISLRAYVNYERGLRTPPLPTLIALADFYDISLDELVGRDWPKETHP